MKPWTVLQELEADNSRLKKEAIIKRESDADNKDFFDGVCMALDGFRTFGIVMFTLFILSFAFKSVKAEQPVDELDIHVNLNNIKNKELIKI